MGSPLLTAVSMWRSIVSWRRSSLSVSILPKDATFWMVISLASVLSGCVYRFSNLYRQPPKGIQTLYVESVFDSSREVVPHEILWEKIQMAFAKNGKVRLTSKEKADAYLQIHLTRGDAKQFDLDGFVSKNIQIPLLDSNNRYQNLSAYENLLAATRYSKRESMTLTVDIDIWDLRTKKKLWSKTYTQRELHKIYGLYTAPESAYLYSEEGLEWIFSLVSDRIAGEVVRDFLGLVEVPPAVL
jgi:hypothetical protein